MSNFNGQININRDLRQNKQTVIGKYDLTDIAFLGLGVGIAIVVAYLLGFSPMKVVDEFTAIIISIAPMILIISFGFKKVAGIRKINFMWMKSIDKKSKYRFNRKSDKSQFGEKFLAGFEIDRRYVNKYINKFLSYDNLLLLSVRYVKDIKDSKNKIYFILDLRYKKGESVFGDILNKFALNTEIRCLSIDEIYQFEENNKIKIRSIKEKDKMNNTQWKKEIIFSNLFIKHSNDENKVGENNGIDSKFLDKEYKIYMLILYDIKVYRKFINVVKRYADVICYFKKEEKKKYVNTFLVIEDEIKKGKKLTKLEKVEKLCSEYGIIIDKLVREQNAAKVAVSYLLTNPFNTYRIYK